MTQDPNIPVMDPQGNPASEPVQGEGQVAGQAPQQPQEPDWYDAKKYGAFTPENVARQAADYKNAVKEMNRAQQERSEYEKKIRMYEDFAPTAPQAQPYQNQYPQAPQLPNMQFGLDANARQRLEQLFPGKTADEILAEQHLIQSAMANTLNPLQEDIAEIRMEKVKGSLRAKDKDFAVYEDTFDAIMANVPVSMRTKPEVVRQVQHQARGYRADDIFETRMKDFEQRNAQPPSTPAQPPRTASTPASAPQLTYSLTDDKMAEIAQASGRPIDEVRTWYANKK